MYVFLLNETFKNRIKRRGFFVEKELNLNRFFAQKCFSGRTRPKKVAEFFGKDDDQLIALVWPTNRLEHFLYYFFVLRFSFPFPL